jgi:hypothetical protein
MLKKIAGICPVEKLRAIQLYEVDLNCYNQFVFGCNAMNKLDSSSYIPEDSVTKEAQPKISNLIKL